MTKCTIHRTPPPRFTLTTCAQTVFCMFQGNQGLWRICFDGIGCTKVEGVLLTGTTCKSWVPVSPCTDKTTSL